MAAIRFAADRGLKVSPRGSGHHYEAAALRDEGLLLDLGELNFVEIDADRQTARVGPGVRGGDLSQALERHGLAFPVGHCVDVGLSGYILSGGFGWNAGEWGAASKNVVALELVGANGELIQASADKSSDLFWAARGGGPGFFAAVTAYHLRLHSLPPATFAWRMVLAAEQVPALADWLTAATAAAHPVSEVGCFLLNHWETREPSVILRVSASGENEAEAKERVASFLSPPPSLSLLSEPKADFLPFTDLFKLSPMPDGKRAAADHLWSNTPLGDVLAAVWDLPSPSRHSTIDLVSFGGHSCVDLGDGALSVSGSTGVGIYALWDDPADDEANRTWVSKIDDRLAPLRRGRYVGEADLTVAPGRRAECFGPGVVERLDLLRGKHDPTGLFFGYP